MSTTTLVLAAALVASTAPAFAERMTYARPHDLAPEVRLSARVKPIPRKQAPRPKPAVTSIDALVIEGLVGTIRDEQEQLLIDLIESTPDTEPDEQAKYYFLLGELRAKQQRYWRLQSLRLAIDADRTNDLALRKQAAAAGQRAKDFLLKAVQTYDTLTRNAAFRNYPRMDLALFYYGYTLQSGRYLDEARRVYDRLLKDHPKSKYVPEAHLAFADYFFEKGQLADAEARYRMVLQFPASSAYWYALYKTGWIDLNLGRHQDALETFYRVAQGTKHEANHDTLHRASKKDFVRAYAEIGRADRALVAFRRVDRASGFEMLQRLADLYLEHGKSDHAIYVYQQLMQTQPRHANVCLWQYHIAHARLSMVGASNADKVRDIEDLVRLYRVLASKRALPRHASQECRDNAAAMSGELARAFHSEAARTRNVATLAHAEKLYEVYLDVFRDAPDHAQTQYFYAELLWARADAERAPRLRTARWEAAAEAFTAVVKAGKIAPKLRREAAYAAVLGWKNRNDVDPELEKQADRIEDPEEAYERIPAAQPIPPHDAKMIAALNVYTTYLTDPGGDELVRMKFLEANLYRRYNHFTRAIPIFRDLLASHRSHEAAEISAQLLLDTYNRMQRYDDLVALARELAADKRFLADKPELVSTVHRIRIQAMRRRAELVEKEARASGNFEKLVACGQAYLAIYNEVPTAAENDEVLYNALVCFQDGKSIGAALSAYRLLEQYYGTSKLYARATGRIGKAYGDIAFYDKAVEVLEKYAKHYAGEADAHQAMNDVVFYSKGLGDDAKAIESTRYFVRVFGPKQPAQAANAMFSLTSVYEKQGDPAALVDHLRAYLRRFGDRGGAARRVIAHAKIGQALWRQSCPVAQVDGSCVKIVRERAIASRRLSRRRGGIPTQCGAASKIELTVIPRDRRKVRAAQRAFAAAASEYERTGGGAGGDQAGARHHYAQAKLALADADYEAYLALAFPPNLDFDPDPARAAIRAKSLQRFDAWLAKRAAIGGRAKAGYEAVLKIVDNASSIAAAARIAQIAQNQSDALFTADIPKDVRTGPFAEAKVEAFCDKMTEIAEPLDATAVAGFSACLARSTKLGWFSQWSKLCERELGQIQPDLYPTAGELGATPDHRAPIIAFEPPIRRLD